MLKNKMIRFIVMLLLMFTIGLGGPGSLQQIKAEDVGPIEGCRIESLTAAVGKKGFHPSKGNYLMIRTYVDTSYQSVDIRLRIYNKKGKYIFQKKWKNNTGGYISYKWKGKPSKKNEANVSSKKYAKDGKYTIEVSILSKGTNLPIDLQTCKLKISKKAPAGEKGLMAAGGIPVLTGDAEVDYMAEQICKEAKIKTSLSDAEKIRRIYHWMTVNQKHVHYYEGGSFKQYFNLSSSKKKIKTYKTKTDALVKIGELIYNNDYSLIQRKWCMEHRVGVCTDNAAIFKILCNHVGIEAGICSGYYLNRNGTKPPHSWNYAIVGSKTYYYDVDVEIQNYGKGQGDYYWYQKTRKEAEQTHQFVTVN